MSSLVDLFNPTFLMFLGIIVLVVSILVVYFESKWREQNHKINSVVSLVSSLAASVKQTQDVLQMLDVKNQQTQMEQQPNVIDNRKLIVVSDDETDEDIDDDIDDINDDNDDDIDDINDIDIDDIDDDEVDENLEINEDLEEPDNLIDEENDTDIDVNCVFDVNEFIQNMEDLENNNIDNNNVIKIIKVDIGDIDIGEINNVELDDKTDYNTDDIKLNTKLKTDDITLEEDFGIKNIDDEIDYKKMSLSKLRNIVVEKALANNHDAGKLKKQELLKLLGIH